MTNYLWVCLIGFVVGIMAGRITTSYRLRMANELVEDAGALLEKVVKEKESAEKYMEGMKQNYDKFTREGCVVRESGSQQD